LGGLAGTHAHGVRAGRDQLRNTLGAADPARRHHRHRDGAEHLRQQLV
jgi:hypothetical protein